VFAALIGRFFLDERLTTYRITACIVVAIGAVCIGHGGGTVHPMLNVRSARSAH
jgi:drug/metabolite transporter (DMT)-like permease